MWIKQDGHYQMLMLEWECLWPFEPSVFIWLSELSRKDLTIEDNVFQWNFGSVVYNDCPKHSEQRTTKLTDVNKTRWPLSNVNVRVEVPLAYWSFSIYLLVGIKQVKLIKTLSCIFSDSLV